MCVCVCVSICVCVCVFVCNAKPTVLYVFGLRAMRIEMALVWSIFDSRIFWANEVAWVMCICMKTSAVRVPVCVIYDFKLSRLSLIKKDSQADSQAKCLMSSIQPLNLRP